MDGPEHQTLRLVGATEHNLAGFDLELPLGAWIAVTGPSGSGKTSLARDTIVRESERRYLGSLSSRARHFLGKLGSAAVEELSGLPVALSVGEQRLSASARSTVGTQTGILDLLRLLFAREAVGPGRGSDALGGPSSSEGMHRGGKLGGVGQAGEVLTRSHFSFNHPLGSCESCGGLGLEDRVDPALLVADPTKGIRAGALVPTLKSGYTVYSQVTVEVMDDICQAHGFDVDTPWQDLTDEQRDVILYGTRALKVPFGKHSIESRMKWEGITARPREEGYYRGLVPVIEETLLRNRNPNILRFVRSVACGECGGTRLSRAGREARVGDVTLPQLLAVPVAQLGRLGATRDRTTGGLLASLPDSPVLAALTPSIHQRLERLQRLGLGHLSLDRTAASLSDGEAQRVRLVAQLTAGLGGMLVSLDEPTLGLHPSEQAGMVDVLEELRALGNTLLVVEHDPDMVRHAGHLVELGPGAGPEGGQLVFAGDLAAGAAPLGETPSPKREVRRPTRELVLRGASLHNLDGAELRVAQGAFNVVAGPSGAGKSSLVFGTLLPALGGSGGGEFESLTIEAAVPATGGGTPSAGDASHATGTSAAGNATEEDGEDGGVDPADATLSAATAPLGPNRPSTPGRSRSAALRARGPRVQAVDARPIGRNPRSTPATWSGLFDLVRKRFAATDAAKALGFGPGRFSFNNKDGRCPACEGLGVQRVGLHLLEDVELCCPDCGGGRYEPGTLAVRLERAEGPGAGVGPASAGEAADGLRNPGVGAADEAEPGAADAVDPAPSYGGEPGQAHGLGGRAPASPAALAADANIAEVLAMDVRTAARFFAGDPPIARTLDAMDWLGLGYLRLGQSSKQLSRGESQRVKLATLLGDTAAEPSLLLLDEPDRGLHPSDVALLVAAIDALVEAGHTLVAISHHRSVWAAADRLIAVEAGTATVVPEPERVAWLGRAGASRDPLQASAKSAATPRAPVPPPAAIELRGVRTHNLRSVDVTIPHRALTVVSGPSGSGKSSLVFDTLAAEAWARFSEGLPFAVRRFVRRLPRPDLDEARGLTPVLALRQGDARADRRSTVATQSETGPLLRLLFSRAGLFGGEPALATHGLTAEHFSTDRALGACPSCSGAAVVPRCDPARLVTDASLPLAGGALDGTRPGRFFTEPDGQHMATLAAALVEAAAGLDQAAVLALLAEQPWAALPEPMRELALFGSGPAELQVTWSVGSAEGAGEHHFSGTWDGLCALVEREARRRVNAKAAAEWAAPLVDASCTACAGSGLLPKVAAVELGGLTLPQLMALPLAEVVPRLQALTANDPGPRGPAGSPEGRTKAPGAVEDTRPRAGSGARGGAPLTPRRRAVLAALLPELRRRLDELVELGLGHLALGRTSRSLSDGELQRVRLAGVLRSGLTSVTLALDEPAAGLHARDVARLANLLRRSAEAGNTPVVVSHRRGLQRLADHHLVLGPGAGAAGGELVVASSRARGRPPEASGPRTTRATRANGVPEHVEPGQATAPAGEDRARLFVRGARAHNLRGIDVDLPARGLVALCGVSGSGKSSLLFDVLGASLRSDLGGSVAVECDAIELPEDHRGFAEVRGERRRGGSAGTVLGALGLLAPMQRLFHESARAAGLDLPKPAFSFQSPKGRCETCKGSGFENVSMDFLADLALPCPTCAGRRYRPEVLAAKWCGRDIASFLDTSASELRELMDEPARAPGTPPSPAGQRPAERPALRPARSAPHLVKLRAGLDALAEVGLGHLGLGRRRRDLSGGELQRLHLAAALNDAPSPCLHLFDEPARGLHDTDITRLVAAFRRLAARGDLVVVAEHRLALVAAADHVIDLGPEGGPGGGRLVEAGPPHALTRGHTAAALRERAEG
ncbi:MAG: hypothetical protein P1V81_05745 [Planctomycetota bacterium]|nr:hypothetical protein [Planctomycetota bacterium]